jgi:hypothetical protein
MAIVFGAGTMTLSLYSLHVVLHTPERWPEDHDIEGFVAHVAIVVAIGAVFVALRRSGPLEWLVRQASRLTAGVLRR